MTIKQENKLSMYLAVLAACEAHLTTIHGLPALSEAYTDFTRHVSNIQRIAQARDLNRSGVANDKRSLRADMAVFASTLALAIRAYAAKTGNQDLASKADIPATRMASGRDTAAAVVARNIYSLATEHLEGLGRFGITAEKVDRLGGIIDAYATSLGKTRANAMQGVTLTSHLAHEFEGADAILSEQMDALVEQFRATVPAFIESYRLGRGLVHLKSTRRKAMPAGADASPAASSRPDPGDPTPAS